MIFTAREGQRLDSRWFYERARGQFINARSRLTAAQQKKFDLEFPKSQVFSKTDLAKFEYSATGRPHIVSRGAQKNFADFASEVGESWSKGEAGFDELWYKRLIAKAIIFRTLEADVPKQPWYEGGYRANIVTYAMAKVCQDANREREVLDLDAIYKRQAVSEPLRRAMLLAAAEAHNVITHPVAGMRNMSEWAKQQACWSILSSRRLNYATEFESCLTLKETARTKEREERKKKREIDGISMQSEVVGLGAGFWREVLACGVAAKTLSPKDEQILRVCASMPNQVPSELQSKHAIHVLDRMKGEGLVVY